MSEKVWSEKAFLEIMEDIDVMLKSPEFLARPTTLYVIGAKSTDE